MRRRARRADPAALGRVRVPQRQRARRWPDAAALGRGADAVARAGRRGVVEAAARECCGYCHADPDCAGAEVSGPVAGGTCTVFHAPAGAPPLRLLNGTAGAGKTACLKR